ncbi:MAG: tripartite tricarboxylate transporter substrate binding protein [Betaproteobacteria bacterium]
MKRLMPPLALLASLSLLIPVASIAQEPAYPAKAIRIVAPFGAGGGGDTSLRLLATALSRAVGQAVVVENKPGGNGIIGATEVLRSPADGYTLFYGSTTTLAANTSLMKQLPYQPGRDFAPISQVGVFPFLLAVNPAVPANSLAQLIALAKTKPLNFASASHAGLVAGSSFARMAGVEMQHVPYKTAAAALTDLVGGQVSMMFMDVAIGLPMAKAGKIRVLGVTTAARTPLLPDVPAISEALPNYEVVAWTAMAAPAGTPAPIIRRLNAELSHALAQPELRAEFGKLGLDIKTRTPEQTAAFLAAETEAWARHVKAAGIPAE